MIFKTRKPANSSNDVSLSALAPEKNRPLKRKVPAPKSKPTANEADETLNKKAKKGPVVANPVLMSSDSCSKSQDVPSSSSKDVPNSSSSSSKDVFVP